MTWDVEYTDEFDEWWAGLTAEEQDSVTHYVGLIEERGVNLDDRYSKKILKSKHGEMRELRVQHEGNPYRVFYVFDPRRTAMLLIGGCKVGDDRFYEWMVPKADKIYDQHLKEIGHG